MSYQPEYYYCKWQKQSYPKWLQQKGNLLLMWYSCTRLQGLLVETMLSSYPLSKYIHLTLLSFIMPHSQTLSLQGPAPTPLLTFKFQGKRHQATFPEVLAKVSFHLIGAIGLYPHCGQRMQCFERVKGGGSPNKSLGLLAEEGRQITIVHFICESTGHQVLFFGISWLSYLG